MQVINDKTKFNKSILLRHKCFKTVSRKNRNIVGYVIYNPLIDSAMSQCFFYLSIFFFISLISFLFFFFFYISLNSVFLRDSLNAYPLQKRRQRRPSRLTATTRYSPGKPLLRFYPECARSLTCSLLWNGV